MSFAPIHNKETGQQHFTIHTAALVPPQRLTHAEREYLVAPCIMIVEGVLNQGYVPGEEIARCQWSGIPLVVNHPEQDGAPISANDPDVLQSYGVGRVYRSQIASVMHQNHALVRAHAELWIDVAQAHAHGGEAVQVMTMLESQQRLEVSTAFYCDSEATIGSFYGVPYREIHRNLRADHLALLPNSIGACSFLDGCGAPRLNHTNQSCACPSPTCTCTSGVSPMEEEAPVRGWRAFLQTLRQFVTREEAALPAAEAAETSVDAAVDAFEEVALTTNDESSLVTEQSISDLRESLYGCLAREAGVNFTPTYIEEVDPVTQAFIYRCGERLCRRYWSLTDGIVTLLAEVEDVQRSTEYLAVPDTASTTPPPAEEMYAMTMAAPPISIKTRVNRLIANGARNGWTEDSRQRLEAMDEATLILLENLPQRDLPIERQEPTTLEDALQYVPAQFRETLSNATQAYEKRKKQLIEVIVANKQNPFERSELEVMTADRLEQLVVMAGEDLPETATRPQAQNYSGRRIPQLRIVTDDAEAVPAPPKTMELVVARRRALGLMA